MIILFSSFKCSCSRMRWEVVKSEWFRNSPLRAVVGDRRLSSPELILTPFVRAYIVIVRGNKLWCVASFKMMRHCWCIQAARGAASFDWRCRDGRSTPHKMRLQIIRFQLLSDGSVVINSYEFQCSSVLTTALLLLFRNKPSIFKMSSTEAFPSVNALRLSMQASVDELWCVMRSVLRAAPCGPSMVFWRRVGAS